MRECVIGGCDQQAAITLSSERLDGRLGWRRADACQDHAARVATWVAWPFDDRSYLKHVATFDHETRTWVPVSEEAGHA